MRDLTALEWQPDSPPSAQHPPPTAVLEKNVGFEVIGGGDRRKMTERRRKHKHALFTPHLSLSPLACYDCSRMWPGGFNFLSSTS